MNSTLNAERGLTWLPLGNRLSGIRGQTGAPILRDDFDLKVSEQGAIPVGVEF